MFIFVYLCKFPCKTVSFPNDAWVNARAMWVLWWTLIKLLNYTTSELHIFLLFAFQQITYHISWYAGNADKCIDNLECASLSLIFQLHHHNLCWSHCGVACLGALRLSNHIDPNQFCVQHHHCDWGLRSSDIQNCPHGVPLHAHKLQAEIWYELISIPVLSPAKHPIILGVQHHVGGLPSM